MTIGRYKLIHRTRGRFALHDLEEDPTESRDLSAERPLMLRHLRATLGLEFFVQLIPNALWSWLFFVWNLGAASFVNILILWGLILATVIGFWRVNILAGILLIPYGGWVGFASVLNLVLWKLNPQILGPFL